MGRAAQCVFGLKKTYLFCPGGDDVARLYGGALIAVVVVSSSKSVCAIV